MVETSVKNLTNLSSGINPPNFVQKNSSTTSVDQKSTPDRRTEAESLVEPASVSTKKIFTVAEASENGCKQGIEVFEKRLNIASTAITMALSGAALLARLVSKNPDDETSFAHGVEKWAKRATAGTLATYAVSAGHKAMDNKDPILALSQAAEMTVPFLSKTENLTVNRGSGIALNTIAMEMKKFFNGAKYNSFGHGIESMLGAGKEVFKRLKENPVATLLDFKNGPGTILASIPVLISPVLKMLGLNDKLVYMARAIPGAALELGKISGSLERGAPLYFASGVNMMVSSAFNLAGGFMPSWRKPLEILTWPVNLLGRLLLVRSIKKGEIGMKGAKAIGLMDVPQMIIKEFFGKSEVTDKSTQPLTVKLDIEVPKIVHNNGSKAYTSESQPRIMSREKMLPVSREASIKLPSAKSIPTSRINNQSLSGMPTTTQNPVSLKSPSALLGNNRTQSQSGVKRATPIKFQAPTIKNTPQATSTMSNKN